MEFICDKDYEYVKGKYFPFKPNYEENDKGALINSLGSERFVRVDSNFDEDSGLDGDLIKEMILKQDGENEHLSHPVRKAMELLPLGPLMIIDTPGIDDVGDLGALRVNKTRQVLNKTDLAIIVADIRMQIIL